MTQPPFERMIEAFRVILDCIEPAANGNRPPGQADTPRRAEAAFRELTSGYLVSNAQIGELTTVFEEEHSDSMIVCKDIPFSSLCEHHLLPFVGTAHVAYIPREKRVVGLSKLPRLLDVFARRLQMQERIGVQVTNVMDNILRPLGSACVIEATHACLACRGAHKPGAKMITSAVTGVFRKPEVRAELFQLIRG